MVCRKAHSPTRVASLEVELSKEVEERAVVRNYVRKERAVV